MGRKSTPYVMRGRARIPRRPTIADPPDPRVDRVTPTRMLPPAAVRALYRDTALDPRLRGVDRYLWRWSVSQGYDLPITAEEAESLPLSRPTPLAEDEAVLVDQAVIRSPTWASQFVFMWFRSNRTTAQMAKQRACPVRAIYDERRIVLAYYLGRFTEIGITIPAWEA